MSSCPRAGTGIAILVAACLATLTTPPAARGASSDAAPAVISATATRTGAHVRELKTKSNGNCSVGQMALNLLKGRTHDLRRDVLEDLEALETLPEGEEKNSAMRELKKRYYSIVIYHIVRQDFFGYSPVYLVGPRLRYVLDADVISYL